MKSGWLVDINTLSILSLLVLVPAYHPFPRQNPNALLKQIDNILGVTAPSNLLHDIEKEFETDLEKSSWLDQGCPSHFESKVRHHWEKAGCNSRLVLQTDDPLLDFSDVALLREVASNWWVRSNCTSGFTYQRKGNKEAHLADLCALNKTLLDSMRACLSHNIYPLVCERFLSAGLRPRLYDALVIRYNSSAADDKIGAGQPMHRDLGLVSVNVMLNNNYNGGGTLFEAQLQDDPVVPIKPGGIGKAIIHSSSHRHAGAGTRSGIREILVLFLTATTANGAMTQSELGARLKGRAAGQPNYTQRAFFHRAAINSVPEDGEAWHYLGMCLDKMSLATAKTSQLAAKTLMHAASLIPNDARLLNNLGLVLSRNGYDRDIIESCCQKSLDLHEKCQGVGCDVTMDLETAALNYGLFLAKRDDWEPAIDVLNRIDYSSKDFTPQKQDALRLRNFCLTKSHMPDHTYF